MHVLVCVIKYPKNQLPPVSWHLVVNSSHHFWVGNMFSVEGILVQLGLNSRYSSLPSTAQWTHMVQQYMSKEQNFLSLQWPANINGVNHCV